MGCAPSEDKLVTDFKIKIENGEIPQAMILADKAKKHSYNTLYEELNKTINETRDIADKKGDVELEYKFKKKLGEICDKFRSNSNGDYESEKKVIIEVKDQYYSKINQLFKVDFIGQSIPLSHLRNECKSRLNVEYTKALSILKKHAREKAVTNFDKSIGDGVTWYKGQEKTTSTHKEHIYDYHIYTIKDAGTDYAFNLRVEPYVGIFETGGQVARMKIKMNHNNGFYQNNHDSFKADSLTFKFDKGQIKFIDSFDGDLEWKGSYKEHYADVRINDYEKILKSTRLEGIIVDSGEFHLNIDDIPRNVFVELKRVYSLLEVLK